MAIESYTDLTKRPPRSPRVRLGGFALLARMLDKGRATIAGKNGEYHFNCPMDQHFLNFVGIKAEAVRTQLEAGKGDQEVLEWIAANCQFKRTDSEIASWSAFHDNRGPSDVEGLQYFAEQVQKYGPKREDIGTWFAVLDLDDFVSFGGKA